MLRNNIPHLRQCAALFVTLLSIESKPATDAVFASFAYKINGFFNFIETR
jgi:hypothetical protein